MARMFVEIVDIVDGERNGISYRILGLPDEPMIDGFLTPAQIYAKAVVAALDDDTIAPDLDEATEPAEVN